MEKNVIGFFSKSSVHLFGCPASRGKVPLVPRKDRIAEIQKMPWNSLDGRNVMPFDAVIVLSRK